MNDSLRSKPLSGEYYGKLKKQYVRVPSKIDCWTDNNQSKLSLTKIRSKEKIALNLNSPKPFDPQENPVKKNTVTAES